MNTVNVMLSIYGAEKCHDLIDVLVGYNSIGNGKFQLFFGYVGNKMWRKTIPVNRVEIVKLRLVRRTPRRDTPYTR